MKIDVYNIWKFSNKLYQNGHKRLARLVYIFLRITFSYDIPYSSNIKKNVVFKHDGLGTTINPNAIIGDGCQIGQNVTIGGRSGQKPPHIGKNVLIGANALVLGDINIGDGAKIGAGCVCLSDVPAGATVLGNLGRILNKTSN